MTEAYCGRCDIRMNSLDDTDEKFECPKCGRIVDWSKEE